MTNLDFAALEAKIFSLKADTFMVLSRVADGLSNTQISKWSNAWNYSLPMIERALGEIYDAFGLHELKTDIEKRQQAEELFRAYKKAWKRPSPKPTSSAAQTLQQNDDQEVFNDPRVIIDIVRLAKRLVNLAPRQKELVNCLAVGMSTSEIARVFRVAETTPRLMLSPIYARLGLGKKIPVALRLLYVKAAVLQAKGKKEKSDTMLAEARRFVEKNILKESSTSSAHSASFRNQRQHNGAEPSRQTQ